MTTRKKPAAKKKRPARSRVKAAAPKTITRVVRVRGSYDAAKTNDINERYYANADALSAAQANNLSVRKKLRERARYERANNSYLDGIIQTLVNTLIGTGPRLRVNTDVPEMNKAIETAWNAWAHAARLPDQLRIMAGSKKIDGESFGIRKTNPRLNHPVKLDLQLLECDHFTSPRFGDGLYDRSFIDGIRFDQWGNPESYDCLRNHPGDLLGSWGEYDTLPADKVVHWYRITRPGQVRGIPEVTPALPLFAQLRRFTLATLTAAETAAMFSAVIEDPDNTGDTAVENDSTSTNLMTSEIERGMFTFLAGKQKLSQLKAEHPASTIDMFVKVLLREIARCLCLPWILAAGDSSDANYSSARLDHFIFRDAISVERQDLEREVLAPMFFAFLSEAVLLPNVLLQYRHIIDAQGLALPISWGWPAWAYLDPQTEAAADTERLDNGTVSLQDVCDERGRDWRDVVRRRVEVEQFEAEVRREAGLTGAPAAAPPSKEDAATPSTLAPPAKAARPEIVHPVQAATAPSKLRIAGGRESITVKAGNIAAPDKLPTFEMLAYTGGLLNLAEYPHPMVIDLTGLEVKSQRRPVFKNHSHRAIVGHTEEIRVDLQSWQITARGVISGTGPDAREVRSAAKNQFPWECSIGADGDPAYLDFIAAGHQGEANGQVWAGPCYILRKSVLNEISFVPLGADLGGTVASVAAQLGANAMTFEQWLLGMGYTVEEVAAMTAEVKAALQKAFEASGQGAATGTPTPGPTAGTPTPGPTAGKKPSGVAGIKTGGGFADPDSPVYNPKIEGPDEYGYYYVTYEGGEPESGPYKSLEEAQRNVKASDANAAAKPGDVQGAAECQNCSGSGTCPDCEGDGIGGIDGKTGERKSCEWCAGTGKCDLCSGSGKIGSQAAPSNVAARRRQSIIQQRGKPMKPINVAATMARQAAAETRRQAAIRKIPGLTPEFEADVNGQRVSVLAHALEHNWTPEQAEILVLRNRRNEGVAPFGYTQSSTPEANALVIEAAMCRARGLNVEKHYKPQVLEALDRQEFKRGVSLQRLLVMAANRNGGERLGEGERLTASSLRRVLKAAYNKDRVQVQAAWTPISVPGILSNVANKEILEGYMQEEGSWKEVGGVKSVSDFKENTSYRLLDNLEYEEVGPGGEIKHGSLDEESYTRQAKTYAKMLSITMQQIVNDDMDAFGAIRTRLGRGSAIKLRKLFWTTWLANVSTLWTAARTNYIEGATTNLGTDGVGLGLGAKAVRQMRSPSADGSKYVGITPSILLVPPELEVNADAYYNNRNYGAGTSIANSNTQAAKYKPVIVPELSDSTYTGYSTTAWWLLIDPKIAAAVVVSFLDGQEAPVIEDAEADFDKLGISFRGHHSFGVDDAEYLVGIRSKGAA